VALPVPADFKISTCTGCGEQYLTIELGAALEEAQNPAPHQDGRGYEEENAALASCVSAATRQEFRPDRDRYRS
jgi:hypothetical protein